MTFNKDYLYDGPWRVLWKTNTAWQKYFDPLNSVADNRAYQWYKEVRLDIILLCGGCTFDCVVSNPLVAEPYRSRGRGYTGLLGNIARFISKCH